MTQEEAQAAADIYNANAIAGVAAVVGQTINNSSFQLDYNAFYISAATVAAYGDADILTKAKYGQAYMYAIAQARIGQDFVTQFDFKLTELLG